MLATAAAVGVNTSVLIQDEVEAIDITEQHGGDVVKKLSGDHGWFESYDGASLTEAIITMAKNRVSNGWACKHVGFAYSASGELGQWCEDTCIWAGGEWRIT